MCSDVSPWHYSSRFREQRSGRAPALSKLRDSARLHCKTVICWGGIWQKQITGTDAQILLGCQVSSHIKRLSSTAIHLWLISECQSGVLSLISSSQSWPRWSSQKQGWIRLWVRKQTALKQTRVHCDGHEICTQLSENETPWIGLRLWGLFNFTDRSWMKW